MVKIKSKGDFKNTFSFLKKMSNSDYLSGLDKYAQEGVNALREYSPVDTGEMANSWGYEIVKDKNKTTIYFTNDKIVGHIPLAILIQYGHATNGGTYVEGVDFINPALRPVFDKIAEDIWEEVKKS